MYAWERKIKMESWQRKIIVTPRQWDVIKRTFDTENIETRTFRSDPGSVVIITDMETRDRIWTFCDKATA